MEVQTTGVYICRPHGSLFVSLHQPAFWPSEQRGLTYVFVSPLLLLFVAGCGWYAARRLELRLPFLIGAVLPFVLVGVTLGTGALLRWLQVDPVHRLDGWLGWGVVAIAFYPAATVWFLSPRWRIRLTVFGIALAKFAGMVFYSWTARERWRYEYYADGLVKILLRCWSFPASACWGWTSLRTPTHHRSRQPWGTSCRAKAASEESRVCPDWTLG